MPFDPVHLVYHGGDIQQDVVIFTVEIIDDDIAEPSREKFEIVGEAVRNLYFSHPIMTVTIIDDDLGN